jgi:hypothetical protein
MASSTLALDREDPSKKKERKEEDDSDEDYKKDRKKDRKREEQVDTKRRKRDRKRDDGDDRRKSRKTDDDDDQRKRRKRSPSSDDSDSSEEDRKRRRRRKKKSSSKKSSDRKRSKSKKQRKHASFSDSSDSSSDSSDDSSDDGRTSSKVVNTKLLEKLDARGETLEERKERRSQKRAAKITSRFGYTAEENPFNDPNLHEAFNWTKKKEKTPASAKDNPDTLEEIDTIRRRREERDQERVEMDRLKAEESRMKELENYDEWAKKEEEFHLQQQRQRSAIRLVEGREKPVDVLAKNLLLFGLSDEEKKNRAAVKYQEKYNALEELESLEAELEEPFKLLKVLKLEELQELLVDINAFRMLEREAMSGDPNSSIIQYWDALHLVGLDEIKLIKNGGNKSTYSRKMDDINTIFEGQSRAALLKMKDEVHAKLHRSASGAAYGTGGGVIDSDYWTTVLDQLSVHLAKMDLSDLHSKMLVRQLERLERKKEELTKKQAEKGAGEEEQASKEEREESMVPSNVAPDFGNLEEELGLTNEVDIAVGNNYSWQEKYRPRKPRYFNRVKTGYDWNKYNQTHYDHDSPPPKTVQGYKFNIFYPDLVDPTKTPQYFMEQADSDDFCILRFHAGAPYEDIAFKIINREWNRSRKRGFRCTFERGVLSLYFNFSSHWYRR